MADEYERVFADPDGFSFEIVADGTFQPIVMESSCRVLTIISRDDLNTFTHFDAPKEFHMSFNQDGSAWSPWIGISMEVSEMTGATACYVRGQIGLKIVITGLS